MEKISVVFNFPSPQPKLVKSGYGGLMGASGFFHSYRGASLVGKANAVGDPGHMDT